MCLISSDCAPLLKDIAIRFRFQYTFTWLFLNTSKYVGVICSDYKSLGTRSSVTLKLVVFSLVNYVTLVTAAAPKTFILR